MNWFEMDQQKRQRSFEKASRGFEETRTELGGFIAIQLTAILVVGPGLGLAIRLLTTGSAI